MPEKTGIEHSSAILSNIAKAADLLGVTLPQDQIKKLRAEMTEIRVGVQSKLGVLLSNHKIGSQIPILSALNALGWKHRKTEEVVPDGLSLFVFLPDFIYGVPATKKTSHPFSGICLVKADRAIRNGFEFSAVPLAQLKLNHNFEKISLRPANILTWTKPLSFIHQPQRKNIHLFYTRPNGH